MKNALRRILIVDADPVFADSASALLSSRGYAVEIAEGIRQAAQRLKDTSFSCVILDKDLTEMKGYDAVPVLKAILPTIPIIVTAAGNSQEQETKIRQQNIFYYHVKGFDLRELEMAVDDALITKVAKLKQLAQAERRGNHDNDTTT